MDFIKKKITKVKLKDYLPTYDSFGKQKQTDTVETAIRMILRLMYTKKNTIASVPDLWIDITRFKHMLDDDNSIQALEMLCSNRISSILADLRPVVNVHVNRQTNICDISVTLMVETELVTVKFNNVYDPALMSVEIDKKNFYA